MTTLRTHHSGDNGRSRPGVHEVLPECAKALATHEEKLANLEAWIERQNGTLQSINRWLIGLLGSVAVSLVLLILNLVKGKL